MRTTTRDRVSSTIYDTLSDDDRIDKERRCFLRVVMYSICYSAGKSFVEDICSFFWHVSKEIECFCRFHSTNRECDYIELFRGDANILNVRFHKKVLERLLISWMSDEFASVSEFSELMSDLIFRYEYRNVLMSIMDSESMSDKFWWNSTWTRPCLDNIFSTTFIHCHDFFHESRIDIWSFF